MEILTLAGDSSGGRGVGTADDVAAALDPVCDLARSHGCVAIVFGPVGLITGGESVIHVQGGSALLIRMTGGGCALDTTVTAFLGAGWKEGLDDVSAVVAAYAVYSAAAERTEIRPTDPGSSLPTFLDALYALEMQDLQNVGVSATNVTTAAGGGPV